MLDHPDVMRPHAGWQTDLTWQLHCPRCGSDVVDRFSGGHGDHDAVVMEPDRDEYVSPVGTRGGYVQIDLSCSAGHRFNLVIGNHKGAEIIGIVPGADAPLDDYERTGDPDDPWDDVD